MTQRKVVLTSTSALAARPNYGSTRTKSTTGAGAACSAAERSEAGCVDGHQPQQVGRRGKNPLKGGFIIPSPVSGSSRAHVREASRSKIDHATDRSNLDRAAQLDGLLSELTKAQRQNLLDRLALENQQGVQNRDLDMWSEGVRAALEATIGASGGEAYGLMLCKRQLGLSSVWRPIEAFMRSSGLADLAVVERQAVYNLLAQLVVDAAGFSARRSGAPLSLKLTASHAPQVSGIFERAFPGYLAAGLAPVIARQSLR